MLNTLTISELRQRLLAREVSSREAVEACLDRMDAIDGKVKAFVGCDREDALAQAATADDLLAKGEAADKPLLGLPIAVKDVLARKGQSLSCCSQILDGFVAPYRDGD